MLEKITEKNYSLVANLVSEILEDDTYYNFYYLEYFLNSKDKQEIIDDGKYYICFADNGNIIGVCHETMYEGRNIIYSASIPVENDEDEVKFVSEASAKWPNSMFRNFSWDAFTKAGLKPCSNISSIEPDTEYHFGEAIFTNGDVNMLRDIFERKYIIKPDEDLGNIRVVDLVVKDVRSKLNKSLDDVFSYPYCRHEYGSSVFAGFFYFSHKDFDKDDTHLLMAFAESGKLIGLIKWSDKWKYYNGITTISFIDVQYGARRKGIAKQLFAAMDKVINKSLPFRMGTPSEMGKLCHITDVCQRYITGVKFVD